jgi:hypothetical protein
VDGALFAREGVMANPRYWSRHVMETSDALDLDPGVFKLKDPRAIAASLKRSAEESTRRKSEPYRSAMSMLVFYINRAGKNLSAADRAVLEQAKDELRALFGRVSPSSPRRPRPARSSRSSRASPSRPR